MRSMDIDLCTVDTATLGQRLRKLRGERSQAAIARTCGWDAGRIYKYEAGRMRPDADSVVILSRAFSVTVESLLAKDSHLDALPLPGKDAAAAAGTSS